MVAPVSAWDVAAKRFELIGAARFYNDPLGFVHECIDWRPGQSLTAYQEEILDAIPVRKRVAVRGPHGLGKTTELALAVLWFACTREAAHVDWKCVTTAGAWRQLEHYLWPEIRKWVARLRWDVLQVSPWSDRTEMLKLSLTLKIGQAFAAAATDPQKIEGAHADSMLYVYDESKAIIPATFDAAEGAFSGARSSGLPEAFALAFSTPGEPTGRFHDIHQRKPGYEDWYVRHVTLAEAVAAGRVNPDWAAQRARQWGVDSALYHNRVLGEFYASDEDAVIPLPWVELANERWLAWRDAGRPPQRGRMIHGVDVARGGKDLTVIARRSGPVVIDLREFRVKDTGRVTDHTVAGMGHPTDLVVADVIGVGAGVVDKLRRMRRSVIGFNASRKTARRDRSGEMGFANLRALMWWNMRESLDPAFDPVLALPPDEDLLGELIAPHWREVAGKILVESKDDILKRLGRSTDHADAVLHSLMTDTEFDEEGFTGTGLIPFREGTSGVAGEGPIPWEGDPRGPDDTPDHFLAGTEQWGQDPW